MAAYLILANSRVLILRQVLPYMEESKAAVDAVRYQRLRRPKFDEAENRRHAEEWWRRHCQ
jgi:hypothetical protein